MRMTAGLPIAIDHHGEGGKQVFRISAGITNPSDLTCLVVLVYALFLHDPLKRATCQKHSTSQRALTSIRFYMVYKNMDEIL